MILPSDILSASQLKEVPVPYLLSFLKRNSRTGILTLHAGETTKSLHFQKGDIVFASSRYPNDRLGETLLKAGKINFRQYEISGEILQATKKKQGAVLVGEGFIKPKDLFEGLTLQVRAITLSLLEWTEGKYEFHDSTLPADDAIGITIQVNELVREAVYRMSDWTRLIHYLPPLDAVLERASSPSPFSSTSSFENEVWSLLNEPRSVRDVLTLSSNRALDCARTLFVFIATGMLTHRAPAFEKAEPMKEPVGAPKSSAEKQKGPPVEEAPPPTEEVVENDPPEVQIKKIHEAFAKLPSQNYYEVMGLTSNANSAVIKRTYFRLAKKYHPDRYTDAIFSEIKKEVETLFIQITKAYDTLSVDAKRNSYDEELKRPTVPISETKQKAQSAQEFVDQAERALRDNNLSNAVYFFEEAIRVLPDGHEKAGIYLRYGQVLLRVPGQMHAAVDALQKSATLDSSNAKPHIEMGLAFNKAGLTDRARVAFQAALKRDPTDKVAREEYAKLPQRK